ncbi:efflux RND transporter periplasmic adaptor subunit [Chryseobacterium piperi]|uniref:efflux RND transporter periplasmic adaptor subunit n=1 Tax=Chryseobacterium piperi TaxID=558152 RepID=UPI00068CA7D8|nr:efflux RND transporter periplasmic adaptor subunit [Chryseobacterium piperi]ASW73561.1 efflux RND transporter periplasmic adaptor subunit [Chryseobacterium piperi]
MIIEATKKRNSIRALLLLTATSIIVYSCGDKKESPENTSSYVVKGDTIALQKNSNIIPKLVLQTIKEEDYNPNLVTVGTVKAIPNSYAEITSPFAGRILKSYIKLGQKVMPGSPLFSVSSADYFAAQKEYRDAQQELRQSELNLKRQQDLLKHGVGIQREAEEAATDFQIKKTALANASAALKIFKNTDKMSPNTPLVVVSPIKGEVITNNIVMGQYLKEDAPPIALVAELSKVWIAGQIKEKDLRFLQNLNGVEVNVSAYPDKKIMGKIYHINEIVNEETRSVEVLIECENSDRILKPGMFVNLKFSETSERAIFVPTKAILQFNDRNYVLVQTAKNEYVKRYVDTGITENNTTQIINGLKPGETIITDGAFYLLDTK